MPYSSTASECSGDTSRGGIDLWSTTEAGAEELVKRQNVEGLQQLLMLKQVELELTDNKGMPDDVIASLNGALRQAAVSS